MSESNICIIVIPLKDDDATREQVQIIRETLQQKANELNCTLTVNELQQSINRIEEVVEQ